MSGRRHPNINKIPPQCNLPPQKCACHHPMASRSPPLVCLFAERPSFPFSPPWNPLNFWPEALIWLVGGLGGAEERYSRLCAMPSLCRFGMPSRVLAVICFLSRDRRFWCCGVVVWHRRSLVRLVSVWTGLQNRTWNLYFIS